MLSISSGLPILEWHISDNVHDEFNEVLLRILKTMGGMQDATEADVAKDADTKMAHTASMTGCSRSTRTSARRQGIWRLRRS